MKGSAVLVATTLAALAAAGPAYGTGTISRFSAGSAANYDLASGTADVTVSDAPGASGSTVMTISETGIGLGGTATDCVDNGDSVVCTFAAGDFPQFSSTFGAGNDKLHAEGATRSTITVQDFMGGDDLLVGSNTAVSVANGFATGDVLRPGPGKDQVFGGDGDDEVGDGGDSGNELVDAGAGDDRVIVLGGDGLGDVFHGGPGHDELSLFSVTMPRLDFTADLAQGTVVDSATGAPETADGFEDVFVRDGNNVLRGTDGPNRLTGGTGNDVIEGRLGSDLLDGRAGTDRIEARDGVADRVDGGRDPDACLLDQLDESTQCELTDVANVTPIGAILPDLKRPTCRTPGLSSRPRARTLRRSGLSLLADCSEPGRVSARLVGSLKRLGGRSRLARAGYVELAAKSGRLSGTKDRARLRLRVARSLRGLLRKRAHLRLELTAVDRAGNRSKTIVRRLQLR
jgi:hypothetical protein